jgi:hypothetical protein
MDELVKSVDALSREQLALLVARLGLSAARVPVLLPGAAVGSLPLAPTVSEEDRKVRRSGRGGFFGRLKAYRRCLSGEGATFSGN